MSTLILLHTLSLSPLPSLPRIPTDSPSPLHLLGADGRVDAGVGEGPEGHAVARRLHLVDVSEGDDAGGASAHEDDAC